MPLYKFDYIPQIFWGGRSPDLYATFLRLVQRPVSVNEFFFRNLLPTSFSFIALFHRMVICSVQTFLDLVLVFSTFGSPVLEPHLELNIKFTFKILFIIQKKICKTLQANITNTVCINSIQFIYRVLRYYLVVSSFGINNNNMKYKIILKKESGPNLAYHLYYLCSVKFF